MSDEKYMELALSLAERGAGRVSPNPMVGAVIVKNGRIIGEGWHARYGGLHAERNALADCEKLGENPKGATIYVTLEPCCHHGKTPPCTDALIAAGIARVVIGSEDPNPLVAGKGIRQLREAGIEVSSGVLKESCDRLNRVFFHYIAHHTPYDRNRYTAIMAGIGTVLADDPLLTCRIPEGKNPTRIIADTHLQIPLDAQIVKTAREVPTILAVGMRDTSAPDSQAETDSKAAALQEAGCQILFVPTGEDGHLHLPSLMEKLGSIGIDSILLEGGSRLNWSALSAGQVHLLQAYLAPKLLGGDTARGPIGGIGYPNPEDCVRLSAPTIRRFGEDILLESEVISPCLPES